MAEWSNATVSSADVQGFESSSWYGLKECFNVKGVTTGIGLGDPTFKFHPLEDSSVSRILKRFTLNRCTPFCVGNLDERMLDVYGRHPGASSSGATVDLQKGRVSIAVTTCTGGSTIHPAARAGLIGFKPSWGLISRNGLVPLCSTLDTVSLMGKNLDQIRSLFIKLNVKDPLDPTQTNYKLKNQPTSVTIAKDLFDEEDLAHLRSLFPYAQSKNLDLDHNQLNGMYLYELCPDFFSNMAKFIGYEGEWDLKRFRSNRSNLPLEVKSRIIFGAYLAGKKYPLDEIKAHLRTKLGDNILITPVCKNLLGSEYPDTSLCALNNLLWRPSITIPSKLKDGVQFSAPYGGDDGLLRFLTTEVSRSL